LTGCISVAELALKSMLPPYLAEIVGVPELTDEVVKVATPSASGNRLDFSCVFTRGGRPSTGQALTCS